MSDKGRGQPGVPRIIFKGPASTIIQHTQPGNPPPGGVIASTSANASASSGVVRHTQPIRAARDERRELNGGNRNSANAEPLRIRRRSSLGGVSLVVAARAVSQETLYLTVARPPLTDTFKPHHMCIVCFTLKSHPVSSKCGHSHCYVCVRQWLIKNGSCPTCLQVMDCAPFRQYSEESSIESDYPEWMDKSEVTYSWEGLKFPWVPKPVIVPMETEPWE
ncbi:hypothetical protein C8R44DRAFT_869065 [Mycena epipterygia]|nr:hypothetical protein C8R44DRAFT_869065 [Mycena epipterygia]